MENRLWKFLSKTQGKKKRNKTWRILKHIWKLRSVLRCARGVYKEGRTQVFVCLVSETGFHENSMMQSSFGQESHTYPTSTVQGRQSRLSVLVMTLYFPSWSSHSRFKPVTYGHKAWKGKSCSLGMSCVLSMWAETSGTLLWARALISGLVQGYFENLSFLAVKKQMCKGKSVVCIEE